MNHIVKRKGHKQKFDEKKVYASVYAACLAAHIKHEEAEEYAQKVTGEINKWIKDKNEVVSDEILFEVGKRLEKLNKKAGFMYITHRDIS